MQCALGQVLPNWYPNRTKYTLEGETVPKKDRNGRPMRDQPQNAQLGTPKISPNIYSAHERIHWANVISHTETTEEDKSEVKVRILQRNAGQQTNKWELRKEQLLRHVVDQQDVNSQLAVEKSTYMNPLQTQRSDGSWGSPRYSNLMPPEYKRWVAERKSNMDYRMQEQAKTFEADVKQVFKDLESKMNYGVIPTSKGIRYHTGLAKEIFEQKEEPGRATMYKANYDRFMRVMTQLEPYGDYTEEEEDQFDEDENLHLVTTEIGIPARMNDGHRIDRHVRRFRRDPDSSSEGTVIAKTITAPEGSNITRPLSERSAFTELGTDILSQEGDSYAESYTESVATETNSEYGPSTASDTTDQTEMTFEYESDNSTSTVCQIEGLARPRAGWNTSSFPSFGNLIPVANNTNLLPKAPNTARLNWMVATNSPHGRGAGVPDQVYLDRMEQTMRPRIRSRQTSSLVRKILSRRSELMPPNSQWGRLTMEIWNEKFPESTINPDIAYELQFNPNNKDLPMDQFSSWDFEYTRDNPIDERIEYNRSQQAVTKQANTAENQWSRSDQERIQNQAHIARAQEQLQNVLPDNQIINTLLDFDEYVNEFLANGHKWNKPAGLSTMITKAKNVTEQSAFEKIMFLNMSHQVILLK